MTTIIRSNVTLSNPRPGSQILPPLDVTGVTHRWHAEAVPGTKGNTVTLVPDSVGRTPLNEVEGVIKLNETSDGARFLEFSTTDRSRIAGAASGDSNEEWSLAGLVYWESAPGSAYGLLGTNPSPAIQGVSLESSKSRVAAYRSTTMPVVWTPSATRVGWHTVVVSYRKNGEESISLDGSAPTVGEIHGEGSTALSISNFSMNAVAADKIRIIDYAFINRALSTAEHARLHAALERQVPAY